MDVTSKPDKKRSGSAVGKTDTDNPSYLKAMFVTSAFSMGWQLAIVVVIPIIGGFEIDQHYHTSPVWEIVGFVVAGLGFIAVLYRQLTDLNDLIKRKGKKS